MVTPNGNRLHIGIFGRANSGKSSLINTLTGQDVAIVSSVRGTTTDPVHKSMEINGLGAVTLIDTAGFDDESELGALRVKATAKVLVKTDVAVLVVRNYDEFSIEKLWIEKLRSYDIPYAIVVNVEDTKEDLSIDNIATQLGNQVIVVNAKNGKGIEKLIQYLTTIKQEDRKLLDDVVKSGDKVILIMPQDGSAPRGRLILPQVMAIRELLDINAIGVTCTMEGYGDALASLKDKPDLVITDSQVFDEAYNKTPRGVLLTSFSVLMAGLKGDIEVFLQGARTMKSLTSSSRVLIAEACSHIPQNEDIGRVKIPNLLRTKYGVCDITNVNGNDFPDDLSRYDLVIHCGACMFNRKLVISRVQQAITQKVAITNYGIAIAEANGILDKIMFKNK